MTSGVGSTTVTTMPAYVLTHRHTSAECPVAFAAWKGISSPLRRQPALSSCPTGGHQIFWTVEASDVASALALLPSYVAVRTEAAEVAELLVP